MQVPSINLIGGALAIVALGAVVFFGVGHPRSVSTVAPVVAAPVLKPPVVENRINGAAVPPKKPVFRKILPGGKLGDPMNCKWAPKVTSQDDKAQILAAAKQYGVSPAQVEALRVCLN